MSLLILHFFIISSASFTAPILDSIVLVLYFTKGYCFQGRGALTIGVTKYFYFISYHLAEFQMLKFPKMGTILVLTWMLIAHLDENIAK